jgi:hypothetical protein
MSLSNAWPPEGKRLLRRSAVANSCTLALTAHFTLHQGLFLVDGREQNYMLTFGRPGIRQTHV